MSGNWISFILCGLLLSLFLVAIKQTTHPYVKQTPVDIVLPNNCVRYEIVPKETTSYGSIQPEIVYSCPNYTTNTITTHMNGKTEVTRHTIVIDNKVYEEKLQ